MTRFPPLFLTVFAASACLCHAGETATPATVQVNLNLVWAMLSGVLVFFMKAGFALLEMGLTRSKNAVNIIMKNFLDFCAVGVVFLFVGFPLMFGQSLGGWTGASLFDMWKTGANSSIWVFWMFQLGFAGVTATIVSGAVAERTKFLAYVVFCGLFAAVIYPIYGHWAWGSGWASFSGAGAGPETMGWLQRMGLRDFAGGSVVHEVGGACALAGALVVGPRAGRFGPDGQPRLMPGHNLPLAALGVFILWVGWYGFNAGSTLAAGVEIGRIAANTTMAPCLGALTAMIAMWRSCGRPDPGATLNGALAGLVAITPACAYVNVGSALAIGAVAGLLATYASILLEKWLIDDAVGAVPVHLVNGFWGMLAVELFDETGFQTAEFLIQLTGAVVAPVFAFVVAWVLFQIIQRTIGMRASETEQSEGLDFHEHSVSAYPEFYSAEQ